MADNIHSKHRSFHEDIQEVIQKHYPEDKQIAIGICFTLPSENYSVNHWVTNLPRNTGVKLFLSTAEAMKSQMN